MRYSIKSLLIVTAAVGILVAVGHVWRVTILVYAVWIGLICVAGSERKDT